MSIWWDESSHAESYASDPGNISVLSAKSFIWENTLFSDYWMKVMKITGWSGEEILKDLNKPTQNQAALHSKCYGKSNGIVSIGLEQALRPCSWQFAIPGDWCSVRKIIQT